MDEVSQIFMQLYPHTKEFFKCVKCDHSKQCRECSFNSIENPSVLQKYLYDNFR